MRNKKGKWYVFFRCVMVDFFFMVFLGLGCIIEIVFCFVFSGFKSFGLVIGLLCLEEVNEGFFKWR